MRLLFLAAAVTAFDCPDPFVAHGDSCYVFASGPSTKTAAAAVCEEYGAMIACPLTKAEADYLATEATRRQQDYWIGASDVLQEGTWKFPCGTATYSLADYWCPGEPNDGGGGIGSGDCARIVGKSGPGNGNCQPGKWADFRCDTPQDNDHQPIGFVCELNREKNEEWWEEGEGEEGEEKAKGDSNPAAITFAVIGCLGCAISIAINILQRRAYLAGGRARTGTTSMTAGSVGGMAALDEAASTYRSPLPSNAGPIGGISVSSNA